MNSKGMDTLLIEKLQECSVTETKPMTFKMTSFFFFHSNNLKKQNHEIHMKTKSHILYKNLSFLHK